MGRLLDHIEGQDAPSGPSLAAEPSYSLIERAAAGKPETQWAAAEPPDWQTVRKEAEAFLAQSKDLTIAVLWARAVAHQQGLVGIAAGLALVHGLIQDFWDSLHPLPDPDDGDPWARCNALVLLSSPDGLLGDARNATVFKGRGVGEIKVRSILLAFGLLAPKTDEPVQSREDIKAFLTAAIDAEADLRAQATDALNAAEQLQALLSQKLQGQHSIDLKPLISVLSAVVAAFPEAIGTDQVTTIADDASSHQATASAQGIATAGAVAPITAIRSRDEAARAIDLVCEFLERTEPTNPAPLLLRRARKMISHNFLQLMKELAPDALSDVARVMGVDPDSVEIDGPS